MGNCSVLPEDSRSQRQIDADEQAEQRAGQEWRERSNPDAADHVAEALGNDIAPADLVRGLDELLAPQDGRLLAMVLGRLRSRGQYAAVAVVEHAVRNALLCQEDHTRPALLTVLDKAEEAWVARRAETLSAEILDGYRGDPDGRDDL